MTAFRTDQEFSDPKPLLYCLDIAIRLALHNGTKPEEMVRERWCETYGTNAEQFDEALTRALTKIPPNSCDGEGK